MNEVVIEPKTKAQYCMIWLHGLGSGADDMASLAQALTTKMPIKHVALNAPIRPVTLNQMMPMPAWYDILGTELVDREDEAGIFASDVIIQAAIGRQIELGFVPSNIYLAGFSQGGAMALFSALKGMTKLAGVISLSAYLPMAQKIQTNLSLATPIFMGYGAQDMVVQPSWTRQTATHLSNQGFSELTCQAYPMGHEVSFEEIQDLSLWLDAHVHEMPSTIRGV